MKHGNRPEGLRYWTPASGVRGQQAERDQGLIARSVEMAITAAGAEVQTGGMIALIPDNPQAFTVPGGDPASQMHMTLCFLGDVSDLDDATKELLAKKVQILAADNGPIEMRVQGVGIWNRDGGDTGDREPSTNTLLQPNDAAQLLRDYADMIGRDVLGGGRYPEQFQPWAPHICAGYSLDASKLPTHDGVVRFSKIRLALAGEDQDFLLAGVPRRWDDPSDGTAKSYTKDGVVEMADTKTAPAEAPEVGKPDANGKVPAFFPCLAIEGMETADGRFIEVGALELRTPPLTLWAQTTNTGQGGHSGAVVTGRLDEAWKIPGPEFISRQTGEALPEGTYVWQARGEVNGDTEAGQMFVDKYLRGNSIDLSEVTAYDDIQFEEDGTEKHRVVVEKGFISASTLCAIPAFPDAFAEIEGEEGGYSAPLEELGEEFPKTLEGLADFLRSKGIQPVVASVSIPELGDACSECLASGEELGTLPPALRKKADAKKAAAKGSDDGDDGEPDDDADDGKPAFLKRKIGAAKGGKASAKTASAGRTLPPLEWFTDPGLSEPTPLQIDPDTGRVFGHIATWGTCHIGVSRRCTPPPKSPSDYAYFNVGALRALDDAGEVRTVGVGHLTMNTGHASLSASLADTLAHYDNTGTVAADLAAGEDAHGIWVAGRLRPELSETQVHALMASAPSGDWRPVDGKLDLAAVLAVNVPGYPVPRARVASGAGMPEIVALVAAGATRPASEFGPDGLDIPAFAKQVAAHLANLLGDWARSPKDGPDQLAEQQQAAALAFEQQALALEFEDLAPAGITDAELAEVVDAWTLAFPDLIASGEFVATEFNWVDKVGGLPKFIKRIVKHLSAKGMDKSRAIATAVNVVKKMCASGDTNFPGKQNVNAGSRAEACGAVADWERKKAQSHAD